MQCVRPIKNINAVSLPRDEAVDHDLVCLPDPVGPGEGLDVVVRVPVGVVDDDGVRSGQVDTQTSSPGIYIFKKNVEPHIIKIINFITFKHCLQLDYVSNPKVNSTAVDKDDF